MRHARIALSLVLFLSACAEGAYRLPYADGREVRANQTNLTHAGPVRGSFDLVAVTAPAGVYAAARGWVRRIEDSNTLGANAVPQGNNNFVWIEHPEPYCQDPSDQERFNWPGKPANYDQTCTPCEEDYCNEWSFYYHMAPGTVTGDGLLQADLSVDDWVEAGAYLGVESDIGVTTGRHVHFHVAVIDPAWLNSAELSPDGDYEPHLVTFNITERPERIPVFCTANGDRALIRGFTYIAAPCPGQPPSQ